MMAHAHSGQHFSTSSRDLDFLGRLLASPSSSPRLSSAAASHDHSSSPSPPTQATTASNAALSAREKGKLPDRRPPVDPLMVAAAAAAGPEVTRNHYLHEYFPHAHAYATCDDTDADDEGGAPSRSGGGVGLLGLASVGAGRSKQTKTTTLPAGMKSQQAPRRVRLARERAEGKLATASASATGAADELLETEPPLEKVSKDEQKTSLPTTTASRLSPSSQRKVLRQQQSPSSMPVGLPSLQQPAATTVAPPAATATTMTAGTDRPALVVKCYARTRIPTPHGSVFLMLYKNNHDTKEHLAFVADRGSLEEGASSTAGPAIRSKTLDAAWTQDETEMERIIRGAYVGRLSKTSMKAYTTSSSSSSASSGEEQEAEPPLVRIHSECFTGETIGSQRCDCGEQLDEAFRLIVEEGRGVIVYLRQEGRGIGLLEKMRAYNLQDLGHDTVAANLLLGHGADLRTYDIAGAILKDLGTREVRLLTNNPDKIDQIEREGIDVVERVAMVPRIWTSHVSTTATSAAARSLRLAGFTNSGVSTPGIATPGGGLTSDYESDSVMSFEYSSDAGTDAEDRAHALRLSGVGMIGASTTASPELQKYLATKVQRMGHMLVLPKGVGGADGKPEAALKNGHAPHVHVHGGTKKHARPGIRSRQHSAGVHPLAASVSSLATDEGGIECGCCGEEGDGAGSSESSASNH